MRKFLSLLFITIIFCKDIFSYEYKDFIIKAQINIYPKLLLFDNSLKSRCKDNNLIFTIVANKDDFYKATLIKNQIEKLYTNLGSFNLKVKVKSFKDIKLLDNSNAYYILNSTTKDIKNVVNIAIKHHAFTFSYDINYLNSGVLLSLNIDEEAKIYINKKYFNIYNIDFNQAIFQTVRFYYDN